MKICETNLAIELIPGIEAQIPCIDDAFVVLLPRSLGSSNSSITVDPYAT